MTRARAPQARSVSALQRTRYFPGLGWLLPRALFVRELEAEWPSEHWDHWMRAPERHRGRDVLHPEMPRDFHNGVKVCGRVWQGWGCVTVVSVAAACD